MDALPPHDNFHQQEPYSTQGQRLSPVQFSTEGEYPRSSTSADEFHDVESRQQQYCTAPRTSTSLAGASHQEIKQWQSHSNHSSVAGMTIPDAPRMLPTNDQTRADLLDAVATGNQSFVHGFMLQLCPPDRVSTPMLEVPSHTLQMRQATP